MGSAAAASSFGQSNNIDEYGIAHVLTLLVGLRNESYDDIATIPGASPHLPETLLLQLQRQTGATNWVTATSRVLQCTSAPSLIGRQVAVVGHLVGRDGRVRLALRFMGWQLSDPEQPFAMKPGALADGWLLYQMLRINELPQHVQRAKIAALIVVDEADLPRVDVSSPQFLGNPSAMAAIPPQVVTERVLSQLTPPPMHMRAGYQVTRADGTQHDAAVLGVNTNVGRIYVLARDGHGTWYDNDGGEAFLLAYHTAKCLSVVPDDERQLAAYYVQHAHVVPSARWIWTWRDERLVRDANAVVWLNALNPQGHSTIHDMWQSLLREVVNAQHGRPRWFGAPDESTLQDVRDSCNFIIERMPSEAAETRSVLLRVDLGLADGALSAAQACVQLGEHVKRVVPALDQSSPPRAPPSPATSCAHEPSCSSL